MDSARAEDYADAAHAVEGGHGLPGLLAAAACRRIARIGVGAWRAIDAASTAATAEHIEP